VVGVEDEGTAKGEDEAELDRAAGGEVAAEGTANGGAEDGDVLLIDESLTCEGEGERVASVVDFGGLVLCVCIVTWSSATSIGIAELEATGAISAIDGEAVAGVADSPLPFSAPLANFRLQQSNTSLVSMLTCSVFLRTSNSQSCLLGRLSSVACDGSSSSSEGAEKRSGNWAANSGFWACEAWEVIRSKSWYTLVIFTIAKFERESLRQKGHIHTGHCELSSKYSSMQRPQK